MRYLLYGAEIARVGFYPVLGDKMSREDRLLYHGLTLAGFGDDVFPLRDGHEIFEFSLSVLLVFRI